MDGSVSWKIPAEPLPGWRVETAEERAALVPAISELAADGYNAEDIGERLNIALVRVQRIARQEGITLAGRGGMRHVTVEISARHMQVVDVLAQEAGVTRAVMLARLATTSLDGGAAGARRLLGKDAKPKRKYVMRKPREPRGPYSCSGVKGCSPK